MPTGSGMWWGMVLGTLDVKRLNRCSVVCDVYPRLDGCIVYRQRAVYILVVPTSGTTGDGPIGTNNNFFRQFESIESNGFMARAA